MIGQVSFKQTLLALYFSIGGNRGEGEGEASNRRGVTKRALTCYSIVTQWLGVSRNRLGVSMTWTGFHGDLVCAQPFVCTRCFPSAACLLSFPNMNK